MLRYEVLLLPDLLVIKLNCTNYYNVEIGINITSYSYTFYDVYINMSWHKELIRASYFKT